MIFFKKIALFFSAVFLFLIVSKAAFAACALNGTNTGCALATEGDTCSFIAGNVAAGLSPKCVKSTQATKKADNNAFVDTLCNIFKVATGKGGKAFAAFAIISLGIGFFTGKVSWGLMIGVACGIAAMFGAPTIVAAIGGGTSLDCGG